MRQNIFMNYMCAYLEVIAPGNSLKCENAVFQGGGGEHLCISLPRYFYMQIAAGVVASSILELINAVYLRLNHQKMAQKAKMRSGGMRRRSIFQCLYMAPHLQGPMPVSSPIIFESGTPKILTQNNLEHVYFQGNFSVTLPRLYPYPQLYSGHWKAK